MSEQLKILSWNVHLNTFARDSTYVVDELEQLGNPDIVCLQEYVEGADTSALNWLQQNGYDLEYLPFAKSPQDQSISQGILTAVKNSVDVVSSEAIVLREDEPRRFRPFPNIRGVIETVVRLDNGNLEIFTIIIPHCQGHLLST